MSSTSEGNTPKSAGEHVEFGIIIFRQSKKCPCLHISFHSVTFLPYVHITTVWYLNTVVYMLYSLLLYPSPNTPNYCLLTEHTQEVLRDFANINWKNVSQLTPVCEFNELTRQIAKERGLGSRERHSMYSIFTSFCI